MYAVVNKWKNFLSIYGTIRKKKKRKKTMTRIRVDDVE